MRSARSTCLLAGLLLVVCGCSRNPDIWVGPVRIPVREIDKLPAGGMSMSFEDGKKRVTVVDINGHTASALIDPAIPQAQQVAAEDELRVAAMNLQAAMERVKGGWIVKGAVSTRVVTRDGDGWQAATMQFSPEAVKLPPR